MFSAESGSAFSTLQVFAALLSHSVFTFSSESGSAFSTLQVLAALPSHSVFSRDGNSSLRLGLESHLSRINKDLGLDLDSWTADSRLDLGLVTRETRKKRKSFGIGVYMNVSLRETVLKKV